ncbi:MAG TPA: DUF1697 domain-containing protein [Bacillota bacterium]|nr:DUF1697 domain-containing protein [Bacillota bacterium]
MTTTYVALLRGVNVGGRVLRMEELRSVCASLGLAEARTYIQSGNVVFRGEAADGTRLAKALAVPVLLRTTEEMAAVVAANPFPGQGADPKRLHVTFLAAEPTREAPAADSGPDEFILAGREVYLHCPGGYGETKLHNAFFERRLGVTATTRNWATVQKLAEMAGTAD